ncbi:unnamed protein product [Umbelopsis vinacea]
MHANFAALSKLESLASSALAQALSFRHSFLNTTLLGLKKELKLSYVAAAIALVVATGLYKSLSYPKRLSHIAHIPALTTIFSISQGSTHVQRANELLIPKSYESNGLVAKFGQFGWEVTVMNPEVARTVLRNPDIFPKTDSVAKLDPQTLISQFFGKTNLALCNGDEWKRRRKSDGPIEILPLLQRFTLDVIGRVGFGFEFNAIGAPMFPYIFWPVLDTYLRFLFPRRQAKHADLSTLNDLFNNVIKTKRENLATMDSNVEEAEKDLLTLMIESGRGENDDSEPLTDEELRSELVLFFFAGHDTTANALAATLYFLAANPDVQEKARRETLEVFGDIPGDVWLNVEQIKQLPYLSRVIKESVRLANPATSIVQRVTTQNTELGGFFIPKDTLVIVDIIATHYHPKYWKNPTVFNPDRFVEGGEVDSQSPFPAYMPFGGGVRQCIGMNFSTVEQRIALSSILRKYELSVPDDSPHKDGLKFGNLLFTLTSKDLKLNFTRRY